MKNYKVYSKTIPLSYDQFFRRFLTIAEDKSHYVLLESGRGGRYSIGGVSPIVKMIGRSNGLEVIDGKGTVRIEGNPLHSIKEVMNKYVVETNPDLPDFQGGAIGFISYDYIRYIEKIPNLTTDDMEIPDVFFLLFEEWFTYDHKENKLWISALYEENQLVMIQDKVETYAQGWMDEEKEETVQSHTEKSVGLKVSMADNEFQQSVRKIQNYISEGDVFQVNLSVRQAKPLHVSALEVYRQLRVLNPSPYMGYFHTPEFQLVSGSPELLVKKKGKEVSTRPIAGTRSRGRDEAEDVELARELIESEKERAEHVMLVDLERNDLGRVCTYGSVQVDEFMVIEKYSHVMHIVSNVKGQLADNKDEYDLINSMFPGGTITGAPKIRTMEIIEELEPVRRGPYTGSLGWIGFNHDIELNIMIRTMLVKENQAYVQAGAGIVIDSIPANEYKESMKKARALWNAKELAEEKLGDGN
ncbi:MULTISPECIES: anthranilate synthase component I family protein [Niallia]|uniref:Aminodeoxychorismate synthase component I n=1 Tax=Niallia circulans TaxID=1397 RepID=A0A268F655_NIACI|nr:anthranilate synthase component I family protein [Niallia circulans]AYV68818.1 anthranilate synthase component I family protein [Niallia circulans]AYV72791.1 anthranilate synthase component I family protein [Niallia circulans]PAD80853.1 aminodeoxychorismate synthase component I [Niallia circulans]QJX60296.1 anthranilate synthase component I family protein [Niallia circulans]